MVLAAMTPAGVSKLKRTKGCANYVVAASDAPAGVMRVADFICDGTDDQVEIQAAIQLCGANGGRVQLSRGLFHTSAVINLRQNVIVAGLGPGATEVRLDADSDCHIMQWLPSGGGNKYFASVQEMTLWGDEDGANGCGIWLMDDSGAEPCDFYLRHVFITHTREENLCADSMWGYRLVDSLFEYSHGYGGVKLMGGMQSYISNCFFTCHQNGYAALYCSGPQELVITNCQFRDNENAGVWFDNTHYSTINGCVFWNNAGAVARANINVFEDSSHIAIVGNMLQKGPNSNYGVLLNGDNCTVVGNTHTGVFGVAAYQDNGAGNVVASNV